ncbi:tetratricopeptide repeat protein [Microvirga antarctica]|uniref:tetratricopeptide repeat protein n=1 Tax=Microvirga antarctica TaxID=2819233 RepID=UPI001B302545|nr:tetratricopeptide repeat protein [Microvirga antarctica]
MRKTRLIAIAAVAFGLSFAPARAATDLAFGAYQRGLYNEAFREATGRIEKDKGDFAAMTLLGELYNQGLGVPVSPAKAADWYRLAAQRGDPQALASLGLMALEGRGMPKNPAQGRAWLEEAAAKGNPVASYNLALILLPSNAEDDVRRTIALLRVAANAELPDAQHALGVLYLKGRGMTRNPAEAAKLFERAALNGSSVGDVEYAILLFNGEGITKNESKAAQFFRRAAAKGNAIAQNRLARLLAAGRGVPVNKIDAAAWHILSVAQGLNDPWLDDALKDLTPEEKNKAGKLAGERLGVR